MPHLRPRECCPDAAGWPGAGCQGTGQMTAARVVWRAVTVTDSGNEHGGIPVGIYAG